MRALVNNDGWGQVGVGQSDMRVAGKDLQHNRQTRTADEAHVPHRIVRQEANGGGPMKEHMEHQKHHLHEHIAAEKERHDKAHDHAKHHIEQHTKRHHDSQHGHDEYKY